MSSPALDSHTLLLYNAQYRVLICRTCQYAIQKSALQSHLLRHKIYRDDRQALLDAIEKLNLPEPEEVKLPQPAPPPVDGLPVLDGLRCEAPDCGHLCASRKRMQRHRSDAHGGGGGSRVDDQMTSVKMQTFFRGTKINYFEVISATRVSEVTTADIANVENDKNVAEGEVEHVRVAFAPWGQSPQSIATTCSTPGVPRSPIVNVNLETITLFHHYISSTSLTLPGPNLSHQTLSYWQEEVVQLAIKQRWLMCGLLAVSSYHLAMFASNPAAAENYAQHADRFSSSFFFGCENSSSQPLLPETIGRQEEKPHHASPRIRCILNCARWNQDRERIAQPVPLQLYALMLSIRAFVNPISEDVTRELTFARASVITRSRGAVRNSSRTPEPFLHRVEELPGRMTEAFKRPSTAVEMEEVMETLSAIAALVHSCETSYASNDLAAAWSGLQMWPCGVSERFLTMTARGNLAALVVVAHWLVLIKRAEMCGYWFLRGLADSTHMMLLVDNHLSTSDANAYSLIAGLMDC